MFLRRPQSNSLRKIVFQVHLWLGVMVALYVAFIGLTGAALVFRPEMQKATFPQFFNVARKGEPDAQASFIIRELQNRYPGYQLLGIDYPTYRRGTYLSYLTKGSELRTVFSHPVSGLIMGEFPPSSWITVLQDLHFDLLGGETGRAVNGTAAFLLILMFATGLVVWWPGIDRWRQSLWVNPKAGWKRINWQLHSATGFWLFGLLMLWAVTGVQFAFREPFRRAVNAVSPLTVVQTPGSTPRPAGASGAADASILVAKSLALVPRAKMVRVVLPSNARGSVLVMMAYPHGYGDTSDQVYLYFDQYTGALLGRRRIATEKQSAGDLFLKWIGPLHVGSFGGASAIGMIVKVLWSALALGFPALAVSGALMWWNRVGRVWFQKAQLVERQS
jgi:uncharacterized iron-regulated membrane protein